MTEIELRNIYPGQKGSDVSNNIAYNFDALLKEILDLKEQIESIKSSSGSTSSQTIATNSIVVSCSPTTIIANTDETKRVSIILKVTNNNTELTYGSATSLNEFYIQNLNTKIYGQNGSTVIGNLTMKSISGKITLDVTINSNAVNYGNISFDVIVNGLTYTQIIPVTIINANQSTARSVFVSTIFKRSETEPSRPTIGSYSQPVPESEGWSDGIPSGTGTLWTCHRRFTSDGGGNQEAYWSKPVIVRDVENEMDVCFSCCDSPGKPGNVHPTQETECWHNEGNENDKWMAISLMENGVWGDWSVLKIKGEDGKSPNYQITIYKQSTKTIIPTKPNILTPDNFIDKENADIKNDTGEHDNQPRNQQWKSRPNSLIDGNVWWFCVGTVNGETETIEYEWSDPLELSPNGESGQTVFMSTIFKRCSAEIITTPTPESTNFNRSVPEEQGWSDGIPADDATANPIWESHRKFTSDGKYPQDNYWSTPVMMMDSSNFDCCYSSDITMPPSPTTHGVQSDEHWHNIGSSGDTWMATSYHNSFTSGWTPWVITQIKGESGNDGDYMKYIYKKSESGVPEAPNISKPSDFVDIDDVNKIICNDGSILGDRAESERNKGWKSAPTGETTNWYMSCALIDGNTGSIDDVTNPSGTWSTPVLTYGVQGPEGVGVSIYFDTNPIIGTQDISTELVDTGGTYSTLHVYEDGVELSADTYSASVINGDWTNKIGYTFQKNANKYVFWIDNFDKTTDQSKPNSGVATFSVLYNEKNYIVCCAWACNWLGTYRSIIRNDVKKDISDAVHVSVNEFGNQYIKELNTTVIQSASGWTATAQRLEKELNTLTGKYTEIEKNIGNISISPDEFKAYVEKTTELERKYASLSATCDNISLILENDNTKDGLIRTGIDIEHRKISLSAETTTFYDNNGHEIAVFANGGISTAALTANSLTAINARINTLKLNNAQALDEYGNATITIDGSSGKLTAKGADISGKITASSGTIGGMKIEGNALTNEGFDNDAYIILRDDPNNVFVGIGSNVFPASSGVKGCMRLESCYEGDDFDQNVGTKFNLYLDTRGARDCISMRFRSGFMDGLAYHVKLITSTTAGTRYDTCVVAINTSDVTYTLPTMETYDDGHVMWFKSATDKKITFAVSTCKTFAGWGSFRSSYPAIISKDGSLIAPTSTFSISSKGESCMFIWIRDIQCTINGEAYHGAWCIL